MRLLPRLVTFSVSIAAVLAADADRISFNRDIRPIMSDTCFRCHGPDRSSRMAGMRLDLREQATKPVPSGRTPIVPGDPAKSEIIERIFSTGARIMPPAYAHKPLTEKQKETIREWVAQGAVYEGHWAYQPIRRPEPPKIADASRIRNPIDNFIQDRLAREGLKPSELADKPTLLRRVSFDLTGLPPTAEEVRAFLADNSPDAYEKVVDRLLASPRMPSSRPCTGSMRCATPIPAVFTAIIRYRRGRIAITCSTLFCMTNRSTSSRASKSPAI